VCTIENRVTTPKGAGLLWLASAGWMLQEVGCLYKKPTSQSASLTSVMILTMRAAIFALLLSHSWIGVFGDFYPCEGFVGLPCTGTSIKCCDPISYGHFVGCYIQPGLTVGEYVGPLTCMAPGGAWCVASPTGDHCQQGRPVFLMIEVTNFCLLVYSTSASD
jgi:hypothetical protein